VITGGAARSGDEKEVVITGGAVRSGDEREVVITGRGGASRPPGVATRRPTGSVARHRENCRTGV
jgi:hypothetical protein